MNVSTAPAKARYLVTPPEGWPDVDDRAATKRFAVEVAKTAVREHRNDHVCSDASAADDQHAGSFMVLGARGELRLVVVKVRPNPSPNDTPRGDELDGYLAAARNWCEPRMLADRPVGVDVALVAPVVDQHALVFLRKVI